MHHTNTATYTITLGTPDQQCSVELDVVAYSLDDAMHIVDDLAKRDHHVDEASFCDSDIVPDRGVLAMRVTLNAAAISVHTVKVA